MNRFIMPWKAVVILFCLARPNMAFAWEPAVVQIGDPKVNSLNVEVSSAGRFMVWFEGLAENSGRGIQSLSLTWNRAFFSRSRLFLCFPDRTLPSVFRRVSLFSAGVRCGR